MRVAAFGRRGVSTATVLALLAAAGAAFGACGDTDERSFCEVYEEWLAVKDEVEALDPTGATAADAADVAEDALDVTRRLREVDQDRYGEPLESLEVAIQDVLRTLESVPDEADYDTWQPLVEESVEDAVLAAERVEELIDPTCRPDT
jgi:hypothetical protein